MKVAVCGTFDPATQYGQIGVQTAIELERLGVDVRLAAFGISAPLPREFTRLLEKPIVGGADAVLGIGPSSLPCPVQSRAMLWTYDREPGSWPAMLSMHQHGPGVDTSNPTRRLDDKTWDQVAKFLVMRLSRSL